MGAKKLEKQELTPLAEAIIAFEEAKGLTDNELSLMTHISVERLHDLKSLPLEATASEVQELTQIMDI